MGLRGRDGLHGSPWAMDAAGEMEVGRKCFIHELQFRSGTIEQAACESRLDIAGT